MAAQNLGEGLLRGHFFFSLNGPRERVLLIVYHLKCIDLCTAFTWINDYTHLNDPHLVYVSTFSVYTVSAVQWNINNNKHLHVVLSFVQFLMSRHFSPPFCADARWRWRQWCTYVCDNQRWLNCGEELQRKGKIFRISENSDQCHKKANFYD